MPIKTIKLLVFIAIILIYAALVVKHRDLIFAAVTMHSNAIIYATLLTILGISMQAYNYMSLLITKIKLALLPTIRIWSLASLFNYAAPFQPGLLIRAKYLKSNGISYTESTATVFKQLQYSCLVGLGIFSIALPITDSKVVTIKIFLIIILFSWLIFLHPIRFLLKKYSHATYIQQLANSLKYPTLWQLALFIFHYLIIALLFFLVLNSFNLNVSFIYSLLLSSVIVVASLASITPNSLGIQELIIGYFIYHTGVTNHEYITLPFVIRLAHILACSIILLLLSLFLKGKEHKI